MCARVQRHCRRQHAACRWCALPPPSARRASLSSRASCPSTWSLSRLQAAGGDSGSAIERLLVHGKEEGLGHCMEMPSICRCGPLHDQRIWEGVPPVSKKMAFVVLCPSISTMPCVLVSRGIVGVSMQMMCFATSLVKESIVVGEGAMSLPMDSLKATGSRGRFRSG